ncbi:dihydrofolate reductase family protein [Haliangium ochraceum]|uniref:Bifunctional deaminase-reductase domain protein n=1 Tax=Haliangium ochraceum (strain DSM 14365 / JCM 11303 / SMP-2) TaxID=502025 RepID=D0LUV8_HALO1|nr:dihydrofolate reductase family protein [Haliangium ochraceum]ACY13998.1 bifunctional deaminase-reductase domain protein [Haliangium ochraceum DSM 14365]
MAILSLTAFTSLDGVVQGPGHPDEDRSGDFAMGGWVMPLFDEGVGNFVDGIYNRAGAFLLGRNTYRSFESHWPNEPIEDNAVARMLNTLPKYVASTTLDKVTWAPSEIVSDPVARIDELKAAHEGELQVHGSPILARSLLKAGVVDELNLMMFPVVLGGGKRLLEPGAVAAGMKLISQASTDNGIVLLRYARTGPVQIGAMGGDGPAPE